MRLKKVHTESFPNAKESHTLKGFSVNTDQATSLEFTLIDSQENTPKLTLHLLPVSLKEVSFGGDKYHKLKSDDLKETYGAPQWIDKNADGKPDDKAKGEKNNSVAYTRETKPKIGAKLAIKGLPNAIAIKIKADTNDGIKIAETATTNAADNVTLSLTESTPEWPNTVKFYDKRDAAKAFKINWKMKAGDSDWLAVTSTKHQICLTLEDPLTNLRQETLFYLGTKKANNTMDHFGAIDKIWVYIKDKDVENTKGEKLLYWGNQADNDANLGANGGPYTTTYLLLKKDGACQAWARFFTDICRALGSDKVKVSTAKMKSLNFPDPHDDYIPEAFFIKDFKFNNGNIVKISDMPGQSNPIPKRFYFSKSGHEVNTIIGRDSIYDPSYGKDYANISDWAMGSVSTMSYFVVRNGVVTNDRAYIYINNNINYFELIPDNY